MNVFMITMTEWGLFALKYGVGCFQFSVSSFHVLVSSVYFIFSFFATAGKQRDGAIGIVLNICVFNN